MFWGYLNKILDVYDIPNMLLTFKFQIGEKIIVQNLNDNMEITTCLCIPRMKRHWPSLSIWLMTNWSLESKIYTRSYCVMPFSMLEQPSVISTSCLAERMVSVAVLIYRELICTWSWSTSPTRAPKMMQRGPMFSWRSVTALTNL